MIHKYTSKSFFVRTKKAHTIVIEDNLSIGMVQAEIAKNFETVAQCISGVGPFQREKKHHRIYFKSQFPFFKDTCRSQVAQE